jgi:methylphosphotriester-DNA--protein-cysteine methyltransferase
MDGQEQDPSREFSPRIKAKNFFTSGASQASHTASTTFNGPFVGWPKSNKYHYPNCGAAKKVKSSNLVTFSSSAEARAAGYVPYGICHPP